MLKSVCMCEPFLEVDKPIVINRPKVEKYGSPSYANRLETQTHAEMAYTNKNCKKQLLPSHSEHCYDKVYLTLQINRLWTKKYIYKIGVFVCKKIGKLIKKNGNPLHAIRLETQTHAEMAYTNKNCKKQLSPPHSELCYDQVNLTLQCKNFQFKFYYYR